MDPIVLSAIKKAKEELALKLESGTSGTGSALAQLKASLEAKLSPWTDARAAKLDKLDATVSSRLSKADFDGWKTPWTSARAGKLDNLDASVSTRADEKTLKIATDLARSLSAQIGDSSTRNLTTVMGRLGSIVGYGERVVYATPGAYTWTVPGGVKKINVIIVSGGGCGGSYKKEILSGYSATSTGQWRNDLSYAESAALLGVSLGSSGGTGAMMEIALNVEPDQQIEVVVGGQAGASSFGKFLCTGGHNGAEGFKLLTPSFDGTPHYSSYPYLPSIHAERVKKAKALGGRALNTNAPEVVRFIDGVDGTLSPCLFLSYFPFFFREKPQWGQYNSFPEKDFYAKGDWYDYYGANRYFSQNRGFYGDLGKSGALEAVKAKRLGKTPKVEQFKIEGVDPKYLPDYPLVGKSGSTCSAGTLPEMEISVDGWRTTSDPNPSSLGNIDFLESKIVATTNSSPGEPAEQGHGGIVIITY